MTKQELNQYNEAKMQIEYLENELSRIRSNHEMVQDVVSGSGSEYPYVIKKFHVEGVVANTDKKAIAGLEHILTERRLQAVEIRATIEEYINTCPLRIQRIIQAKYIDGKSWSQTAKLFGKSATADSIRMELERYLKR